MNDGIGKELTELTKEVNAVDLTEGAYSGARRIGLRRMIVGVAMSVTLLGGGVAGAVTLWPAANPVHLPGDGGEDECETPTEEPEEPTRDPTGETSYPDNTVELSPDEEESLSPTEGMSGHDPTPTGDPDCEPGEDPTCFPEEDAECEPGEGSTVTEEPEEPTQDPTDEPTDTPEEPSQDPTDVPTGEEATP